MQYGGCLHILIPDTGASLQLAFSVMPQVPCAKVEQPQRRDWQIYVKFDERLRIAFIPVEALQG